MKRSLSLALVLFFALIGLGLSIRCYSCSDYTGGCTKQMDCSQDDGCLTLWERGGNTHRRCMKYSECDFKHLSFIYPQVSSFTFKCCNMDLCNSAPSAAGSALIGLLCSLFAVWWCVL